MNGRDANGLDEVHNAPSSHAAPIISRRGAITAGATMAGAMLLTRCISQGVSAQAVRGEPRLAARPAAPTESRPNGTVELAVPGTKAAAFFPPAPSAGKGAPLVIFLHGANRVVDPFVERHVSVATETGTVVVAPYANGQTWDAIRLGAFGDDVRILDDTLRAVFRRALIDPARIIMTGFSDGATYAIAMGRANGDLFARIGAYSPGFLIDVKSVQRPPILISHGTQDRILPIEVTSRRIVPQLRTAGYSVDYREFTGPHTVREEIVVEVVRALAKG
jgi:phospholipase/carboxylesterase